MTDHATNDMNLIPKEDWKDLPPEVLVNAILTLMSGQPVMGISFTEDSGYFLVTSGPHTMRGVEL